MKLIILTLSLFIFSLLITGPVKADATNAVKVTDLDPKSVLLLTATANGDADTVKRLIAEQVSIEVKDDYGRTPLHIAAEFGQLTVAALLVESGADIEARTHARGLRSYWQHTPLMVAVDWGHADIVYLLISAGADVNARDGGGNRIWHILHIAAKEGRTEIVKLLVDNGAKIDILSNPYIYTPLLFAAQGGYRATSDLLIKMGANINAVNLDGSTPLYLAAMSGAFEIVKSLVVKGAEVKTKTIAGPYPGETPLHAAAYSGNTKIARLLLTKGSELNVVNQYGFTPLRRAVDQGNLTMAGLLIDKGADLTTVDTGGLTLLHTLAQTDRIALSELLIARGAEINAKDTSLGFTPLDYAQGGDPAMIELLERHGGICTSC